MQLNVKKPGTYYISFKAPSPNRFTLTDSLGRLYYFRHLNGKTPRIKFNILHPGLYRSNVDFEVVKIAPVEYPSKLPKLPVPDRNRMKRFTILRNNELTGTPARIFTGEGIIEMGRDILKHPPVIRLFILLHEIGHFLYSKEEDCDLFALVNYLQMGYNRSIALYALTKVLNRTPGNDKRIREQLKNIQKTQKKSLF